MSYDSPASPAPSEYSSSSATSSTMSKEEVAGFAAVYGMSSAHDWQEPRYSIWVGPSHTAERPAIQGYATQDGWCLCWGNPLAVEDDLETVAKDILSWAEQRSLSVLWCCVDIHLQSILAHVDYAVVSCIKVRVSCADPMRVRVS